MDLEITHLSCEKTKLDWYHKETWSAIYINFSTNHPISNKIGLVKGLVDRAIKLSSADNRKKNLKIVKDTLKLNNYPQSFTNNFIKERIHQIYNQGERTKKFQFDGKNVYCVFPYIKSLSERLKRELKKLGINAYFRNLNTMRILFHNNKDKLKKSRVTGVVYKINCKECSKCYIGQTKNNLCTRISQHKNNIKNGEKKTGLSEHSLENSHHFDFDNVTILEKNIHKKTERLTLENFHIKKYKNNVNYQKDSETLNNIYSSVI